MEEQKTTLGSNADKWNEWTHVFVLVDGILQTVYASLHAAKAKEALLGIHKALQGVDEEFVKVSECISSGGEVPPINLPPASIEDWGSESVKSGIIDVLQSVVELMITEVSKHVQNERIEMLLHSLAGLATALANYKSVA